MTPNPEPDFNPSRIPLGLGLGIPKPDFNPSRIGEVTAAIIFSVYVALGHDLTV